jgi:hypothetical protein
MLTSIRPSTSPQRSLHVHFNDTIQGSLTCALQSPREYIHSAGVQNVAHSNGDVDTADSFSIYRQRAWVNTAPSRNRIEELTMGKKPFHQRVCERDSQSPVSEPRDARRNLSRPLRRSRRAVGRARRGIGRTRRCRLGRQGCRYGSRLRLLRGSMVGRCIVRFGFGRYCLVDRLMVQD